MKNKGNNGGHGPSTQAGPQISGPGGLKHVLWPFIGEEWSRYRRP